MIRWLSLLTLLALVLGGIVGSIARVYAGEEVRGGLEMVGAFGGLWLNALRMTVVPLVFSLLVTGVAAVADATHTGRLAVRAISLFALLLVCAALYATGAVNLLLALWPFDVTADSIVQVKDTAAVAAIETPTFAQWLQSLAPSNPIQAAATEAILPLVVFACFFGFAATRLPEELRTAIVTFFRAISEAMIVIVRWVLYAGPLGVFSLALGLGLSTGYEGSFAVVQYAIIVALVTAGISIFAIALALIWGRAPIGKYAVAIAPVLAVAFSTQSSLASLPAMLTAARNLGIRERVIDLVLPMAVAVFKFTSPVANLSVAFCIAALYGLEPTPLQITAAILVSLPVSVAAVGLPGQVSFFTSMAPICIALGVPLELLGVLIAIEVIPDIFRTLGNVLGDVAVTTIVNRGVKDSDPNSSVIPADRRESRDPEIA